MKTSTLRDDAWSGPAIERIASLVADRTGLIFSRARQGSVEAAVQRHARSLGHSDLTKYGEALAADPAAVDALAAELTIGETYFFRDTPQFELLRSVIVPAIASTVGSRPIRAWSAGCASGEEPYSLAMLFHEHNMSLAARVLGTDLSHQRLALARKARYGRWSLRGVSDETVARYFTRRDSGYELAPRIRAMAEFRYLNLAVVDDERMPAGMDLILCRNVLIYFDGATIERVARRLLGALAPTGWLLLGASDPPVSDYAECEVMVTPAGLVDRPPGATRPRRPPMVFVDATEAPRPARHAMPDRDTSDPASRSALPAPQVAAAENPITLDEAGWVARVRALADSGALHDAGKLCAAALEAYPLSAELTCLEALLLINAGRFDEAAKAARRAVYLNHGLAMAHVAMGDALFRLQRRDEADRAYRTALRLLAPLGPDDVVPASGGERRARFAASVGARMALSRETT